MKPIHTFIAGIRPPKKGKLEVAPVTKRMIQTIDDYCFTAKRKRHSERQLQQAAYNLQKAINDFDNSPSRTKKIKSELKRYIEAFVAEVERIRRERRERRLANVQALFRRDSMFG